MSDDLEHRKGLPPELLVLAEQYPRDMWRGHRNFPGLTAFWLQMHDSFREVNARLIADSQSFLDKGIEPRRFGAGLSRYTGHMLDGLHGHHNVEDHHYFPIFVGLDPRISRAFDLLDADHHALHDHMERLADATNAVLRPLVDNEDARDPAGALLEVQEDFRRFLERHLWDEEDVIVPLILEHGADLH